MTEIDVPSGWERSVELIVRSEWRKIMVLGAVDTGKSTYCGFLSRKLLESGSRVAIVDADVGQKDIGPPASITLGYPAASGAPTGIEPASFYFVGAVSPAKHLLPMAVGTRQLVDSARASRVIINTTGMIHGIGRVLKTYKIDAIRPDIIIAIQKARELKSLLKSHRNYRILRLNPSAMVSAKSPEQRRAARERAFRSYFADACEVSLALKNIIFQRSLLFSGKPIKDPDFIYREKTSEGDLVISKGHTERDYDLQVISAGFEKELLCGVADRRNVGLGLALIIRIDFKMEAISLLTPVRPEKIKVIQFGDIYLGANGRELNQKRPGYF